MDKCDECGSELGHYVNCPNGAASTPDGVIGGPAVNRDKWLEQQGEETGR